MLGGCKWSWVEFEISWVEVDGAECSWVHGLVTPFVEGVAESWVEAEMSWVEVCARFSNTQNIISTKLSLCIISSYLYKTIFLL